MKVRIPDLSDEVRSIEFTESEQVLNEALANSPRWQNEYFVEPLTVTGEIYRTGTDVHFHGVLKGLLSGACARCLEDSRVGVERDFAFVIEQVRAEADAEDDSGLGHYRGDEVDLGPLVCDEALLGLDSTALCDPECRGLCAGCGSNLNLEACRCKTED